MVTMFDEVDDVVVAFDPVDDVGDVDDVGLTDVAPIEFDAGTARGCHVTM